MPTANKEHSKEAKDAKRAIKASWAKKCQAHDEAQAKRVLALSAKLGFTFPTW